MEPVDITAKSHDLGTTDSPSALEYNLATSTNVDFTLNRQRKNSIEELECEHYVPPNKKKHNVTPSTSVQSQGIEIESAALQPYVKLIDILGKIYWIYLLCLRKFVQF